MDTLFRNCVYDWIYYLVILVPIVGFSHPVDLHPPDKEELWIDWVEAQEDLFREEGYIIEIEDEEGNVEEALIGKSQDSGGIDYPS